MCNSRERKHIHLILFFFHLEFNGIFVDLKMKKEKKQNKMRS